MPLRYQTHRPPELLEELRNLYRKVDKAASQIQTIHTTTVVGDDGDEESRRSILVWHLLAEFNTEMPSNGTVYELPISVPSIALPYTHLELNMAVLGVAGTGIELEFTVQGSQPYWMWDGVEDPGGQGYGFWMLRNTPAKHYVVTPPFSVGRYHIEPTYAVPVHFGDLAFMPIYPRVAVDGPAWPEEQLNVLVRINYTGGSLSGGFCYKAKLLGRYAIYLSDVPFEGACLWAQ